MARYEVQFWYWMDKIHTWYPETDMGEMVTFPADSPWDKDWAGVQSRCKDLGPGWIYRIAYDTYAKIWVFPKMWWTTCPYSSSVVTTASNESVSRSPIIIGATVVALGLVIHSWRYERSVSRSRKGRRR